MAIKGPTSLLLLALAFYGSSVSGVTDCTLPWNKPKSVTDVSKLGVLGVVEYGLTNICPSVLSGPNKEYCCYTISGDVKCCDQQESAVFGIIFLIAILIITLMSCCCIYRICCPNRSRGQNGIVLIPVGHA